MRKESGQAVVIVAFLMVALFGFAALSIDIGSLVARRESLQKAADAAALYGATVAPGDNWDQGTVTGQVDGFLQSEYGIPASETTVALNQGNQTVSVSVTGTYPLHLATVIGISSAVITRSATAKMELPEVFDYALFSNEDLNISNNQVYVNGNAHSNSNVNISTNNGYINYVTEAHGVINLSYLHFQTNTLENAPYINMPDFSTQMLQQAEQLGQVYYTDYNINSNNCTINGTIYVYGNVNISTNNIKGNGSIFATGDINIDTNNASFGSGYIAYYSEHQINVSTNNLTGNGVLYAPNGVINISANNISISDGAIVGQGINLSANTLEIVSSNLTDYALPRTAYLTN